MPYWYRVSVPNPSADAHQLFASEPSLLRISESVKTAFDSVGVTARQRRSVVYKVPESHTQVKVQIPYQKMTLVEVEVTV